MNKMKWLMLGVMFVLLSGCSEFERVLPDNDSGPSIPKTSEHQMAMGEMTSYRSGSN